ncbi:MAG: phage major capsid protein [Thioalkalivibrio sp.]|nr:phage major capsid protein [Thioalkalivibrio sp.]
MSTALTEAQERLDAARREAKEFYDAHPDSGSMSAEDIDTAKQLKVKMADLHDKAAAIQEIEVGREQANQKPVSTGTVTGLSRADAPASKGWDLGESLRSNEEYMRIANGKRQVSSVKGFKLDLFEAPSLKAALTLSDAAMPEMRLPGIVPSAQEEATVADLMLQGTTDNNTLTYLEETTFTNAADTVAENAAKPESDLVFTERTDNVRKIATWISATDELIADVPAFESYIRERLGFMVRRTEEDQLINGDGTAPNISGILDRSGLQTQTSGLTHEADAIYAAITKVRANAFAEPTAVVINPLSWANLRTEKDDENRYLGPGPFQDATVERIWGLPVRVTSAIAEGSALVGAFRPYSQIFRREGLSVGLFTEHDDWKIYNRVLVLAEERLALAVYRPAAFCQVTGLASS